VAWSNVRSLGSLLYSWNEPPELSQWPCCAMMIADSTINSAMSILHCC